MSARLRSRSRSNPHRLPHAALTLQASSLQTQFPSPHRCRAKMEQKKPVRSGIRTWLSPFSGEWHERCSFFSRTRPLASSSRRLLLLRLHERKKERNERDRDREGESSPAVPWLCQVSKAAPVPPAFRARSSAAAQSPGRWDITAGRTLLSSARLEYSQHRGQGPEPRGFLALSH